MSSDRPQPDNSLFDRIMELHSRKQVIEHWLATAPTPAIFAVMQDMLSSVESELAVLRHEHFANISSISKRWSLDDRRS